MKFTVARIETLEVESIDQIPEGLHVVLSKEEAQQLAHQFLLRATPLLEQAQRLADKFRFVLHSGDRVYLPNDLTDQERQYNGPLDFGTTISPYTYGGEWMTSSGYKGC